MPNSRVPGFLSLIAILITTGSLADDAPDVRKLMTADEYQAAGIEKLSADEVAALNSWLLRYTAKEAPEVRRTSKVVKQEIKKVETEAVRTRIAGEFRGWSGKTVFRLQNGQVWQQRVAGNLFYRGVDPEVELRKNLMGYWELRLLERDRGIGVKRLE